MQYWNKKEQIIIESTLRFKQSPYLAYQLAQMKAE